MRYVAWMVVVLVMGVAWTMHPPAHAKKDKAPPHKAQIDTPHGNKLDVVYHPPRPVPGTQTTRGTAVILAPGGGYHMDLPLLTMGAEALSDAGFHAFRFNWGYFTKKTKRSADLKTEQADLEAVVAWARKTDGVKQVILAGKSLGSMVVVNRAAEKHDDLAGVALLTFPIHNPGDATTLWFTPETLDKITCPVMIAVGDADPLASLGPLYGLIAKTKRPAPIVIAPGEHSFRDPKKKDDKARTAEHLQVVVDALVLYCKRWAE